MAEINRITSFKTFSEIKETKVATKLAEENATKRSVLSTRISVLLDEMEINSFEDLAEDAKREFITKAFGNVSEEEVEVEVSDEIEDEEVTEKTYNKKSLMKAMKADDGMIQLGNGEEYIIYAYGNGNDDNDDMWNDKTIFALDQDGDEYEIEYSDIVSYNESVVNEAKEFSIKENVQHELNEAIIITGKRGAKKVFNQLVKIWNEYPAFGANDKAHTLGVLRQLFFDAMEDANFSREAYAIMKTIKGNIKPVTIKVTELGGAELRLPMPKIREAISELASRIANAGEWGGITIVEGTAMFLDYLKETKTAENLLNGFNSQFESVQIMESRVSEGRAFVAAARKAKDGGLEEFEYDGKKYPVLLKETKTVLNEGTRGQVGIIDKKGNITSIYTHYDSYPENVLPVIKKHYKNAKAVNNLVAKGNSSGIGAIDKMNFYNDGSSTMTGKSNKIDAYLKDADRDGGAEYVYLYDEATKKWMMADIYKGKGLTPAFESVNAESTEEVEEGNAFGDAVKKAKEAGEKEFEFEGKTFKVEENEEVDVTPEVEVIESCEECNCTTCTCSSAEVTEEVTVNEAEIKSDEEFTEYANTVLQKAFGEDFDEAKAKEVIDGILSKSDGDYGAAVGMLTSSLGESVELEAFINEADAALKKEIREAKKELKQLQKDYAELYDNCSDLRSEIVDLKNDIKYGDDEDMIDMAKEQLEDKEDELEMCGNDLGRVKMELDEVKEWLKENK